jgi:hypothetical protein
MAQDPKKVAPKVGAYDKPERGATGAIVAVIVVIAAVLLVLWLFTDIL